jgi:hypothetical protein
MVRLESVSSNAPKMMDASINPTPSTKIGSATVDHVALIVVNPMTMVMTMKQAIEKCSHR